MTILIKLISLQIQPQLVLSHHLRQLLHHASNLLHLRALQPSIHVESLQAQMVLRQIRRRHRERLARALIVRHHRAIPSFHALHRSYFNKRHVFVIVAPPRPFSASFGVGRSSMMRLKSYNGRVLGGLPRRGAAIRERSRRRPSTPRDGTAASTRRSRGPR